jgi:hypothetical protein
VRTIGFGRLNNMRSLVKATLLAATLLATGTVINAQVSIGIVIAPPPPARAVVVVPERPAPEFAWVEGYWYPVGNHYKWHEGYWTRPPYQGAHWVVPHHDGKRYYAGYWEGDRGRVDHDHHSDHGHDRDHDKHGKNDKHDHDD